MNFSKRAKIEKEMEEEDKKGVFEKSALNINQLVQYHSQFTEFEGILEELTHEHLDF